MFRIFIFFAILLTLLSLSSCTFEKRLYRSGWSIDFKQKSTPAIITEKEQLAPSENIDFQAETESEQEFTSASTEVVPEILLTKKKSLPIQINSPAEPIITLEEANKKSFKKTIKKTPARKLDELYRIMLIGAAFFIILIGIYVMVQVSFNGGLIVFGLALLCIFVALAPDFISDVIVSMFREIGSFFLSLFRTF
jgi:membrane glycosyltransferase